jgi:ribosomal protein L29
MIKDELKKMDTVGLEKEIESLRRELFNLKLGKLVGGVKDTSQFKKLRVNIAQALTFIQQNKINNNVTNVSSATKKSVKRNTRTK